MHRLAATACALVALVTAPGALAGSWAAPEIKQVVQAGLMAPTVKSFRPADPLTRSELGEIVAALTQTSEVVVAPERTVTVRELDAALVRALGVRPAARALQAKVAAAGLAPPARLGNEVVARLLGLRTNHPAEDDGLELLPDDPVTRAETAYSVARALQLSSGELDWTAGLVDSLQLPAFEPWQRAVLAQAVRWVGYPYIWGGTSDGPSAPFGVSSRGGFDCSGFVWRVYKLTSYAGAPGLSATLRGRTTYQMSGEVERARRIGRDELGPGDVIFFGDRGPRSKPAQVGHMGIYVGGGWFVHSSGRGVTMLPLDGWYSDTFAWGRRPLAEAGLM